MDDITVEEVEAATVGSGVEASQALQRDMGAQSDSHGMEALSQNSHTQ